MNGRINEIVIRVDITLASSFIIGQQEKASSLFKMIDENSDVAEKIKRAHIN